METKEGDTVVVVYFDDIEKKELCPVFKAYRTHKVAKQRPAPVIIYDYYDNCECKENIFELIIFKNYFQHAEPRNFIQQRLLTCVISVMKMIVVKHVKSKHLKEFLSDQEKLKMSHAQQTQKTSQVNYLVL